MTTAGNESEFHINVTSTCKSDKEDFLGRLHMYIKFKKKMKGSNVTVILHYI